MRFLLDEHIAEAVADALRRRGFDVITVKELKALGAPDKTHMQTAIQEQRIVVTQDADFLVMHANGVEHFGIVYTPQGTTIGALVRGLWRIVEQLEPVDMMNHIEFV
jgi:predicted nuclease of predicted toxin-antitoxin system